MKIPKKNYDTLQKYVKLVNRRCCVGLTHPKYFALTQEIEAQKVKVRAFFGEVQLTQYMLNMFDVTPE